jgi:hypothetical protein
MSSFLLLLLMGAERVLPVILEKRFFDVVLWLFMAHCVALSFYNIVSVME